VPPFYLFELFFRQGGRQMKKIALKMVLVLCIFAVLIVGICGCTHPVQTAPNAVSPSNKAVDYGNAFVNVVKQNAGENASVTSSSVVATGSDAALMTIILKNTTHDSSRLIWQSGTVATYALNIKQFSSTDDASAFYGKQSFGLTPQHVKNASEGQTNVVSPYKTVTGNDPTTVNAATGGLSFNFVTASETFVAQTNEFVIYGTISVKGI